MKTTLNFLIDFFATLYDLVIEFFALQYNLASDFIIFLGEYLKWVTTSSSNSTDFTKHAEEPIKVRNQNPFDIL
ncbi:hypothetical protein [Flavobacterium granuli]|uniref:Uncharacterized protein n=1 Tax=Flavobacterium granuli TaxID=280093 RepID=A0ABU1S447_9FLAO|nr:hypothetical protein [Flavobacterium granuli]MDR6845811.1 hypothetical protein [Flavobacterium granuli]